MPGPAVLLGHMRATESDWHRRQDAQTTFPTLSPTSADLPIPHLHNNSRTVSATSSPLMSTRWLSETDNFILPPEPQAVKLEPLKTPDDGQEPKLELFDALHGSVDAALEIAPTSPRNAPSLRLPSFELLGIAARQSDRQVLDLGSSIAEVEAGSPIMAGQQKAATANPGEPSPKALFVGSPSPPSPPKSDSKATRDPSADIFRSPIHQRVTTITPPGESGSIDWSARVTVRLAGVDSPTDALEGDTTEPSQGIETETSGSNAGQPPAAQVATVIDPPQDIETWLSAAVETIISTDHESKNNGATSIKVLSHALPYPSATGHAFPKVIKAIQDRMPPNSVTWINVSHAVHDRFRLSDIPTSPPITPASSSSEADYFSSKIFDSAVSIIDYQLARMPTSPHPAVSPGSLDVSICERYIPPTSIHEFHNMFSTTTGTSSLLVDRLVELAPTRGRLLFIYPTRAGARTFMDRYLGPVLDPIIRRMSVLYQISVDLRNRLGRMDAVSALPDFALLADRLRLLCQDLSSPPRGAGSAALERLRQGASFAVEYESCARVRLDRNVWAKEWWVKQERRRVRDAVTEWFQMTRSQSEMIPVEMIDEVLNGVGTKEPSMVPTEGVEVGVFVIVRKS